jgi:hypothetical protein
MSNTQEMVWHNDGHVLHVRINKSELEIVSIDCPSPESGECRVEHYGCAVQWFLDRYGFECNAGACPASESIPICWTLSGDGRELDSAQLWFMPLTDEIFHAWLTSRQV